MKNTTPSSTGRTAKGKSPWRKVALYATGLGLAAFIVTGLMPKPVEVEVESVTRGPLTVSVLEEGKTRIRNRYVVSPPVAGYLKRVPVRAGDPIDAGKTLLAVIQSSPSSFLDPRAKAQAEAAVRSADAVLQQRNEQVQSATAELDLARKELVRAEQLRKKGAIAVQEFDTAVNHVEMLSNQVGSAHFALKVAEFELEQSKAALVQATGESVESGQPIEIRAPVSGFVLNVLEESARPVTPGLPIMEVGDPKDLEAEIELLSSDAVNVKPGADVSIEQWGGGDPLHGKVALVEPGGFLKVSALGVEEQRVKVRVNFTNLPEGVLGDRYRVEARIVTWSGENILQVPTGALFRRGNEWMTFVVAGGRAKLTKVSIGHTNGISAEVLGGLSEGQRVILHPPDTVAAGAAVKPRP
ncbi:MAG: HlyD family efflux transporter periplasmic adaptor subunit [Verrucomicrobia bacterium]|nr:HlyD family efflux transporter periplasmic adaptor subunit [Verrucomicrobiota bacterium]